MCSVNGGGGGGYLKLCKAILGASFFYATFFGGSSKIMQIKIGMHQPSPPLINVRSLRQ